MSDLTHPPPTTAIAHPRIAIANGNGMPGVIIAPSTTTSTSASATTTMTAPAPPNGTHIPPPQQDGPLAPPPASHHLAILQQQQQQQAMLDPDPSFSYSFFSDRRHERHGMPTDPSLLPATTTTTTTPAPAAAAFSSSSSSSSSASSSQVVAPPHDWRMRERLKTVSVALVLCLNIGIDPPDVVKTSPCAKLEAWVDPGSLPPQKALEAIGRNLQQQYEIWQPRARYRLSLDPSVEETKKLCCSLRRNAKEERILFHYNGHGVPRPTPGGEIWVFNKNYTQYIPVSVYDIQTWLGAPCIYVLDCSNAGNILEAFNRFAEQRERGQIPAPADMSSSGGKPNGSQGSVTPPVNGSGSMTADDPATSGRQSSMKDCIQLAACGPNEVLPMNPDLPADLFSCCLTTPIEIALRWFVAQNPLITTVTPDMIMKIPGRLNDRRTPLGELNWIFTAITDTIAWNVLPHDVFKRLFRQDLMVAALFRNFLLAERIMRYYACTPQSHPALPPTHQHPMWAAWDLAAELCISQLPGLIRAGEGAGAPAVEYRHSNFFSEQLTAFEIWLTRGGHRAGGGAGARRNHPEQLPIVLQVLLSQVHRLRALMLLSRFLDLGSWSVHLALSVGIFPYVLKLLQSPAAELKPVLVFIWAKILAVDPSCQNDLLKDNGYTYFVSILSSSAPAGGGNPVAGGPAPGPGGVGGGVGASTTTPSVPNMSEHRAMCCFILAVFCNGFPAAQEALLKNDLLPALVPHLEDPDPLLRQWACLCAAKFWENHVEAGVACAQEGLHDKIAFMLVDPVAEVRAAAVFALGTLVPVGGAAGSGGLPGWLEGVVCLSVVYGLVDASPVVRKEVVVLLSRVVAGCEGAVVAAAYEFVKDERGAGRTGQGVGAHFGSAASLAPSSVADAVGGMPMRRATTGSAPQPLGGDPAGPGQHYHHHHLWRDAPARTQKMIHVQVLKALLALSVDPFHVVAAMASSVVDAIMYRVMVTFGVASVVGGDGLAGFDAGAAGGATAGAVPAALGVLTHGLGGGAVGAGASGAVASPSSLLHPASAGGPAGGAAAGASSARTPQHLKRSSSFVSTLRSLTGGIAGIIAPDITPDANPSTPSMEKGVPVGQQGGRVGAAGVGGGVGGAGGGVGGAGAAGGAQSGVGGTGSAPMGLVGVPKISLGPDETVAPLKSVFFNWSLEYFTEPQMKVPESDDPGSQRYNERLWKKERNDRIVYETSLKHDQSGQKKFENQICFLHSDNKPGYQLCFHAFENHLAGADEDDGVIVYNWKEQTRLSWFSNSNPPGTSVSYLRFINEDDSALLVTGATDGAIRIYRKYDNVSTVEIVSAWKAIKPSIKHTPFLRADWQQASGSLIVSGEPGMTRIWDVEREVCAQELRSKIPSNVMMTSLHSDGGSGDLIVCGYSDGLINVHDKRMSSEHLIFQVKDHRHRILSAEPRFHGPASLISGDASGKVQFLDLRQRCVMWSSTCVPADAKMTAFSIHKSAPLFACGTDSEYVWVYNVDGKNLSTIRYNDGFLGPRIGSVGCMDFHPHYPVLAFGTSQNASLSVFASDVYSSLYEDTLANGDDVCSIRGFSDIDTVHKCCESHWTN
ncbi:hypothetical protein HDU96_005585 [Phlyctochytrium bullatum]|nr:hypothetical protein HDU96_005585 [Phlyctochytrium bullatum]